MTAHSDMPRVSLSDCVQPLRRLFQSYIEVPFGAQDEAAARAAAVILKCASCADDTIGATALQAIEMLALVDAVQEKVAGTKGAMQYKYPNTKTVLWEAIYTGFACSQHERVWRACLESMLNWTWRPGCAISEEISALGKTLKRLLYDPPVCMDRWAILLGSAKNKYVLNRPDTVVDHVVHAWIRHARSNEQVASLFKQFLPVLS